MQDSHSLELAARLRPGVRSVRIAAGASVAEDRGPSEGKPLSGDGAVVAVIARDIEPGGYAERRRPLREPTRAVDVVASEVDACRDAHQRAARAHVSAKPGVVPPQVDPPSNVASGGVREAVPGGRDAPSVVTAGINDQDRVAGARVGAHGTQPDLAEGGVQNHRGLGPACFGDGREIDCGGGDGVRPRSGGEQQSGLIGGVPSSGQGLEALEALGLGVGVLIAAAEHGVEHVEELGFGLLRDVSKGSPDPAQREVRLVEQGADGYIDLGIQARLHVLELALRPLVPLLHTKRSDLIDESGPTGRGLGARFLASIWNLGVCDREEAVPAGRAAERPEVPSQ